MILAHHSAYGVNAYDGQSNNLDEYTQQYIDLTLEFKDIILLELVGHFHQDQFRTTQSVVTHIVPSLSM